MLEYILILRRNRGNNMIFSMQEAIFIDNILKQKGINRGIRMFDSEYLCFSIEQLEQIDELLVTGSNDISFLQYFPNLKKLTIKSVDYNQVIGTGQYQNNGYFNQISDFSVIRKCKSLEELYIENDICIETLNVQGLEKLRNVYLIHNPRLTSIIGLDQQHHLEHVVMYGNNIKQFPNITDYLFNTLDAKQNILDSTIFFTFIHSVEDAKKLNDMELSGKLQILFAEKSGFTNYNIHSISQITTLYIKFYRLFEQKGIMEKTEEEKIVYVIQYVCKYIRFAKEQLQEREKLYMQLLETYSKIPNFYKKNLGSLHSSFNTYHFKCGNCEGIVNLMRFMLSILNVDTENVYCHDKRGKESMEVNHSLLRAKSNGKWSYYDVIYDRKSVTRSFGKSFEEISEYADLSIYEKMLTGDDKYEYNGTTFTK